MTEGAAALIWSAVGVYALVGAIVAAWCIAFGLKRLEPGAAGMPLRVRLLIAPGLTALWPLILARLAGVRAVEDRA
jgi:hypothetical protein